MRITSSRSVNWNALACNKRVVLQGSIELIFWVNEMLYCVQSANVCLILPGRRREVTGVTSATRTTLRRRRVVDNEPIEYAKEVFEYYFESEWS